MMSAEAAIATMPSGCAVTRPSCADAPSAPGLGRANWVSATACPPTGSCRTKDLDVAVVVDQAELWNGEELRQPRARERSTGRVTPDVGVRRLALPEVAAVARQQSRDAGVHDDVASPGF